MRNVTHVFGKDKRSTPALAGVDLTVEPGEFVCLVGSSGCGKTTLLKLIGGFFTPTEGPVEINGTPVSGPGTGPRHGVPGADALPVAHGARQRRDRPAHGRACPRRSATRSRTRYLEMVGLADVADQRPYELSGGMQQRCAIARALANDPAIILMDEPFGALDALTRERLQQELKLIWEATGKSIVFVTHSVQEAVFLSTRVVVLSPRPGPRRLRRADRAAAP